MAIFIIILCLLLVFGVITARLAKKTKSMMMNDPLFALSNRGFLGFVLGDSKNFVWSRINHLGLMTQEEIDDYKSNARIMEMVGGIDFNSINVAKNKFEEINQICLGFNKEDLLNSIMVYVKDKPNIPTNEYMKELSDKYVSLLGRPNAVNSSDAYVWAFRGSSIVLFNDNNEIILHIHN